MAAMHIISSLSLLYLLALDGGGEDYVPPTFLKSLNPYNSKKGITNPIHLLSLSLHKPAETPPISQ
ncbi:hypothetical protein HanRHA438_Chr08g0367391 [Helianthus annuus]|uniref:Uncharacterized protein n=1 Tax=Helianthus annuus TaxID=4232 RepID=A0A9K3II26_HELAN|nr:hypothetical protein HanXRQr2_Chr08g0355331 [Helianthus annuus]KAJ0540018.1 hypothetical protein HanHA300_Chr08g0293381 [Helianthus annuus]KAJ0720323.1 hypothetical protein HanLR1_Chr08g0292181 [Helianthus annuus]KAJ0723537.1 hypothetical protein HanOQP8_Chr08g0299521 [Helianthus annuus]KAJ0899339.1 hypothetical protein HanRHA438_Chr08g0367391 [Helianthus annuus]